jgi:large subunit ribosomal protein L7Ae
MNKYRAETKQAKKQRLLSHAEKKAAGKGDVRPSVPGAGVNKWRRRLCWW